ncbi:hypothetical protein JTE90_014012 [Oedothorax gibbosus]|uniref:Uncharacterized protein n=1 Tax=Oedothorax gibbosus TaxID=931172 RepID=A0AAV6U4H7_9ARAC|nr:hypothetical protein JTE90_014012 [Oedothorax gibbosus]
MGPKKKGKKKAPVAAKRQGKKEEPMELGQDSLPNVPEHETIVTKKTIVPENNLWDAGSLDSKDHVLRTDETTEKIRKKLIKTGRYDQLSSSLSTALFECGWKTDIENYCKWVLKRNPNLSYPQLVEEVRMRARNIFPQSIKQNLAENIQNYYLEPEPSEKPAHSGELSSASCSGETCSEQNTVHSSETSNTPNKILHSGESLSAEKKTSHKKSYAGKKSSHSGESLSAEKKTSQKKSYAEKKSSHSRESSNARSHSRESASAKKKSSHSKDSSGVRPHSGELSALDKSSHSGESSRVQEKSSEALKSGNASKKSSKAEESPMAHKITSYFGESSTAQKKSSYSGESTSVQSHFGESSSAWSHSEVEEKKSEISTLKISKKHKKSKKTKPKAVETTECSGDDYYEAF